MEKKVRAKRVNKNHRRVERAVSVWQKEKFSNTDTLGAYTGVPSEKEDLYPEQDADDL